MKLVITRSQSKGLIGGVSFEVRAQVRLDPAETELVRHYKLEQEVLLQRALVDLWGRPTDTTVDIRVKQLLNGDAFKCKNLGEVMSYTESVKNAAATLKRYIETAQSFGGEESFDI
jgi:hypothetical protein